MPMRRLARIVALAAGILASGGAFATERIVDFDSRVEIGVDAALTVTETISVVAEGDRIRRGIYRDFPTDYPGPVGTTVRVGFSVLGVLRDGAPEAWFTDSRDNGIRLYIGRKDVFLQPGHYTYTLTYRTDRQIGNFADYDELYWNATGNGWDFAIEHARATIVLPPGAKPLRQAAYTGRSGAKGQDWIADRDRDGSPAFATTRVLAPGEGLTVAVSWPSGLIARPGGVDRALWWLRDALTPIVAAIGVLVVLGYFLFVWTRLGRDPPAGTVFPRFVPPRGISPAAARFIVRMRFDAGAIGAVVVSLAVKGRLVIEEGSGKDFHLRRLYTGGVGAKLSPGERAFEEALFAWGDRIAVTGGNRMRLKPAVDALQQALSASYDGAYFVRNRGALALGFGLSALAVIATFLAGAQGGRDMLAAFSPFIAAGLLVIVNVLFVYLMKAPTVEGRGIMDEIEGFRMYLATAERERLNLLNPPERTPALFEKYLPYAMALDVETEWGEQFADVLAAAASEQGSQGYQPIWYQGSRGWGSEWSGELGRGFGAVIGDAIASTDGAIAAAATPPGSSSGSGDGGFSDGGFSGGGGGGGGGDGW